MKFRSQSMSGRSNSPRDPFQRTETEIKMGSSRCPQAQDVLKMGSTLEEVRRNAYGFRARRRVIHVGILPSSRREAVKGNWRQQEAKRHCVGRTESETACGSLAQPPGKNAFVTLTRSTHLGMKNAAQVVCHIAYGQRIRPSVKACKRPAEHIGRNRRPNGA